MMNLEDMFGRRSRPLLQLHVQLWQRPPDDPHEELHIFFLNEGRAVARFTRMLARVLDPSTVIAGGSGIADVSAIKDGAPCFMYIDNVGVIHPNGITSDVGHAIIRRDTKGAPLKLHARWYCDGMRARNADLDLVPGVLRWNRGQVAATPRWAP